MIQISEWIVIASSAALLLIAIGYLFYFKLSRKLFPQVTDFASETKPNEGMAVFSLNGSGIIKTVEIKTNGNCIIDVTIDGYSHTMLTAGAESTSKSIIKDCANTLIIREQLDQKFHNNFTVHIQSRSEKRLQSNGQVSFEIRMKLRPTIKALFSELR